jgi:TolB-like protein
MPERDDPLRPFDPSAPEGLVPGQAFGQYTLVEEVGRGGMGVVWKAHHPVLNRDDALKFLSPQLARSNEARERFIREGRSASALKHSGIATVYSAGETDGKVYIALEYIDGDTVSEFVSRGPLSAAEAFRVAIMAGRAIGYAHAHHVLHRDVTSRNVMITRDGNVVVVDFGLAVVQGETRFTQSGAVLGTLPYMAPEQFAEGRATEASDVYGLGVVLYEMLTGTLPFKEEYAAALMWTIANRDPDAPSVRVEGLDPEVDRIIAKALAKAQEARYRTAEELVADLEALLQSGVLPDVAPDQALVRSPSQVPTPSQTGRPRRKRLLLGLTAVAGIAVALVIYYLGRPGGTQPVFASVAVLPFETVGPTGDLPDWLLSGLGEQLTAKLAKLGGCRVVTWTSSRRFPAKDRAVHDIAEALGVEGVVLVSVRSSDGRLIGSISLVDGQNEFVKWSGDFEEAQSDLFAIEHDLAVAVTEGLFGHVSGEANHVLSVPSARSADAYEFYLKGANALQEETEESNARAFAFFDRAQELDPQLVDAYIGAGASQRSRYFFGWGGERDLDLAEENYQKALELDPDNLAAIRGLIGVGMEKGDSEPGLRLAASVPIDDQATVDQLLTRAVAYASGFLPAKAIPLLERVLVIEPSHQAAHFWLLLALSWSGYEQRCIEEGEVYFSLFGEDPEIHLWVAVSHDRLGHLEEATVHYRRAWEMFSDVDSRSDVYPFIAEFFMRVGRTDEARKILEAGIESSKDLLSSSTGNWRVMDALAFAYALQGDREKFLATAETRDTRGRADNYGVTFGYFLLGLDDLGAKSFCDEVARRTWGGDFAEAIIFTAPPNFLSNKRVQHCLEELRRWQQELTARY